MLNWLFDKKKNKEVGLAHIGIDIHSHIIPGIDDGVETVDEAVAMAAKMQSLGYSKIVTSPHVMWDCYRNTPEIIQAGLEDVRQGAKKAGLSIQIDAAAEYFIDEHFNEMLASGQRLMTLPGNRLLVELPYSTPLMNTSENLFSIISKGYQPVLAHPERYTYFYSDPSVYKKLADGGCELQVNILSLTGYYGENILKMAEWLLKNNLVTFLGTDAHKIQHLELIQKSNKHNWVTDYPFQNEKLINI
ncbi:tyrosine-protein phosphatase [Dyadobacter chenhuakuii]|uniref:protein-tyrosine-phosphatase n=1 Tax=Dyadobacter chenhuakuii TaxID=2909339 RepID=A0A9X1TWW5_9BACT|nr:CpsB/CapC family capsule biosynthesis tyrosine phosphatase [Dyadobacter chenhuakuii]MCF2494203.1 histidinol phosphatase [Dyadobacter chenhuakuii]MCF2501502.1 histidinol phosphatase [Dyadobacter chenhuakuii]USJ31330.1 histidinol phosphatase [Dyadobacter chenhuakuii]